MLRNNLESRLEMCNELESLFADGVDKAETKLTTGCPKSAERTEKNALRRPMSRVSLALSEQSPTYTFATINQ